MNSSFGNTYNNARDQLADMARASNGKKNLGYQSESLFGMALYDFDTVANDVGLTQPPVLQRPQSQAQQPVFHPVDEYKDMSLKEILDFSDDFLASDAAAAAAAAAANSGAPTDQLLGNPYAASQAHSLTDPTNFVSMGMASSMAHLDPNMGAYASLGADMSGLSNADILALSRESLQNQQQLLGLTGAAGLQGGPSSFLNHKKRARDDAEAASGETAAMRERRFRPYQAGQWAEKFEELCAYRKEKGHCLVPHTYSDNLALARWVKRQRYQYKLMMENKASTMTPERVKALEDIGFVWDSQGAAWGDRLNELEDFRRSYMHCNVPSNFSDNPRLATWIKCQRRQYKLYMEGKPSNMTPQRIQHLESLGFEWELRSYKKQRQA